MAPYGLRRTAMYPVYGLAEASVAVTFPPLEEEFTAINLDREFLNIAGHTPNLKVNFLESAVLSK